MDPVVRTLLSLQRVQVQSLVRELGCCLGTQAQQGSTPQPQKRVIMLSVVQKGRKQEQEILLSSQYNFFKG